MLGGDCKDFTMRLKRGAQAGGRDGSVLNFTLNIFDVRTNFRQVGIEIDGDEMAFAGGGVKEIDFAELVVDQRIALTGKGADVGAVIMKRLGHRF